MPTRDEPVGSAVEGLLAATRVLVGIASRGLEQLGDEVTISQFRLLAVLAEHGPTSSSEVAEQLGAAGSSVTRVADRLEDAGHLVRRRERPNRSVVRLELTDSGRALVNRVMEWRRSELEGIVAQLPSADARAVETGLGTFVEAAGHGYGAGPVELKVR